MSDHTLEQRLIETTAANLIAVHGKVLQLVRGEIPYPEVVELFLTNYCAYSCPFCRCKKFHGEGSEFLNYEVLSNLLDELASAGIMTIEMGGGGEPLEHPQIRMILERLSKDGFRVGLITNGYVLTQQPLLLESLLECADWVRFSIDAVTDDIYRIVHGGQRNKRLAVELSYSAVREVVGQLARDGARRARSGGTRPRIGIKLIIQRHNKDQLLLAVDEALDLGVDYLQFKWLENHPWSVPAERRPVLLEALRKRSATIPQDRLMIDLLLGYGGAAVQGRCVMSVLHPVIDWDGAIYMCAFFHHRRVSHSIGNIRHQPFLECWGSQHHREQLKVVDPAQCVPNCPMLRYNPVIEFIKRESFRFRYI